MRGAGLRSTLPAAPGPGRPLPGLPTHRSSIGWTRIPLYGSVPEVRQGSTACQSITEFREPGLTPLGKPRQLKHEYGTCIASRVEVDSFPAPNIVPRRWFPAISLSAALVLAAAFLLTTEPHAAAAQSAEMGRFVWRDLLTKDVNAAKRFYEGLFGWRFEDTTRGDRPYVLVRSGGTLIAGIVDVNAHADAAPQWLSYMAVADVDKTVDLVRSDGGKVLVEPRDLPIARVAAVADPQGAPLGLAQLRRDIAEPAQAAAGQFFWQEYLARDATQALGFYKRLAGYELDD